MKRTTPRGGPSHAPEVALTEASARRREAAVDYPRAFACAWQTASKAAGELTRDVRLCGVGVRLRFAGSALADAMMPALAGEVVASAAGRPRLTIELWDAASTGVAAPPLPWSANAIGARGVISAGELSGVRVAVHGGVGSAAAQLIAVSMFDEAAGVARFFVRDARLLPWYERAAPLRTILHWALRTPDRLLVHAGAVGIGDAGVLVVGPGGSGKSMTAVACALAGSRYLGDDYVVLDLAADQPLVHPLYATAKLAPGAQSLIPELSLAASPVHSAEKHVLDVRQLAAHALGDSQTVTAVVLPRLTPGTPTSLRPASASEALLALAPSTIFQAPRDAGAFEIMARLVRRVPALLLQIGGPPSEAATEIAGWIEKQTAA